jgi:hypothetical protein
VQTKNVQFPKALKKASPEEKCRYFESGFSLKHPSMDAMFSEICHGQLKHSTYKFVMVVGPTGIGKTHLAQRCIDYLNKDVKVDDLHVVEQLPAIYCRVQLQQSDKFSWKAFYQQLIDAYSDSLNIKIYGQPQPTDPYQGMTKSTRQRTEARIRSDFEERVRHFGTRYILVDEIQDMLRWEKAADRNLDILRGIADTTGCKIIGLGTYHAAYVAGWSAQLSRRGITKDFSPYDYRQQTERVEFFRALVGLMSHLPHPIDRISISSKLENIYMGCLGCIGLLHDWLSRALTLCLSKGVKKLTFQHLEATKMDAGRRTQIATEIREGRIYFQEDSNAETDVERALFGVEDPVITSQPKPTPRKSRPGERNPERDAC